MSSASPLNETPVSPQLDNSTGSNDPTDFADQSEQADQIPSSPSSPSASTSAARKRTRASAEQLAVLEDTFAVNVSPNNKLRKQLAEQLQMSERSIQIWFQNRRAKVKHMQKRAQMQMQQASIRAQLYHYQQQQQQQQSGYSTTSGASAATTPNTTTTNNSHHNHNHHHQNHHHQQQQQHVYQQQQVHQYSLQNNPHPHHLHHPQQHQQHVYHQQQLQLQLQHQHRMLSRAQSVDAIQPFTPPYGSQWQAYNISRQSMPPNAQDIMIDLPDYLHGPPSPSPSPQRDFHSAAPLQYPLDPTLLPTLVPVPDAGPTAMLATHDFRSKGPNTPANTPPTDPSLWPTNNDIPQRPQLPSSQLVNSSIHPSRTLTNPTISTVNPAALSIPSSNPPLSSTTTTSSSAANLPLSLPQVQGIKESYFNASTLIIGSWHRLKLRATDLLCVYKPELNHFSWHITDSNCHFKMVTSIDSVSSISHVSSVDNNNPNNNSQMIYFDITEPPLFYMEANQDGASVWIQCSDFTEGKQASRFFRHTLKGIGHTLKEDLMVMMNRYEKLRRLVRFLNHTQVAPEPMVIQTNYTMPVSVPVPVPQPQPQTQSQSQQAIPYWPAPQPQPLPLHTNNSNSIIGSNNMFMNQSPVGGFFG
ncbi:Homeodomain-like DNA binding domain-containing transcription factor [Phycomyces blakesleeanus]|uniref:Homeodomain-like DNA binding domain-containing transcription factor n=1 Tax=Phycomyces blakesleeanus TaxID=4837 RepID=A0ABR3BHI3_PHYBL